MNLKALILCILVHVSISAYALDINYVRANYDVAVNSESTCAALIQHLSKEKSAVALAYLGAFETIWANHTMNPMSKLNTFNKGVKKINKAVSMEPNNIEVRFVRYSIQKNAPGFLNYKKNIKEDRQFIINNKHTVKQQNLLRLIEGILK